MDIATIETFHVLQPPTSGDVVAEYRRIVGVSNVLDLTIKSARQVPRPTVEQVAVRIQRAEPRDLGAMMLSGTDTQYGGVLRVETSPDPQQPAIASWVRHIPTIPDPNSAA